LTEKPAIFAGFFRFGWFFQSFADLIDRGQNGGCFLHSGHSPGGNDRLVMIPLATFAARRTKVSMRAGAPSPTLPLWRSRDKNGAGSRARRGHRALECPCAELLFDAKHAQALGTGGS
jgi:hypothetical protein